MEELSTIKKTREGIIQFEEALSQIEGAFFGDNEKCPLKHSFTDGIYVREIFIPVGMIITGKIHKHAHPNFLMSGIVEVVTESNGRELLEGPMVMISAAGTKRALITKTDCHWVTIHSNPTNTHDLDEIEKIVIAKDFEEYEKFIESKEPLMQ